MEAVVGSVKRIFRVREQEDSRNSSFQTRVSHGVAGVVGSSVGESGCDVPMEGIIYVALVLRVLYEKAGFGSTGCRLIFRMKVQMGVCTVRIERVVVLSSLIDGAQTSRRSSADERVMLTVVWLLDAHKLKRLASS